MCQAIASRELDYHFKSKSESQGESYPIPPGHFPQLPYLGLFNLLYSVLTDVNDLLANFINLLLSFVVLFHLLARCS